MLLVSNHLTYYMDSIVVFHSVSYLRRPYLIWPRTNLYIVAALETMKSRGWLPRLMAYNGTICVKRTWKEGEQVVDRKVDPEDIAKIDTGLRGGWVLTYPQGTTTPGAPGRIGCAKIIKHFRPIVVPVRLDGLREAFDKTGLKLRKTGRELAVRYGRPLDIDYDQPESAILARRDGGHRRGVARAPGFAWPAALGLSDAVMRSPRDFFKPLALGAPEPVREIPVKPSRSIHFFDPSNQKMAAKLPDLAKQADILLGNLEDAIPADKKIAARDGLVRIGREIDFGDTPLWTRVNSLDSPWCLDDLVHAGRRPSATGSR